MPASETCAPRSVLIVGFGSIGRRHFQNLRKLGIEDVRILRSNRKSNHTFPSPPHTTVYVDLDAAIECRPDFAIVSNPTSLHVPTAKALVTANIPVLLEKPVADSLRSSQSLMTASEQCAVPVSMGYCFRYHPLYRRVKHELSSGRFGRVFYGRLWQSSYLPDWHPWEDYRDSYAARRELGGGVVKTLDHELDMLRWLLGEPDRVIASVGTLSSLEVNVEDTADMVFHLPDGLQAAVHVSFARRGYDRGLSIVGEQGTCQLDWQSGTLSIQRTSGESELVRLPKTFDLNSVYVDWLRSAIEGFSQKPRRAAIPLADGIEALRMAEAALRSSELRRGVSLNDFDQ